MVTGIKKAKRKWGNEGPGVTSGRRESRRHSQETGLGVRGGPDTTWRVLPHETETSRAASVAGAEF